VRRRRRSRVAGKPHGHTRGPRCVARGAAQGGGGKTKKKKAQKYAGSDDFDEEEDSGDDWDMPNPLGVYARSKYMGERFVCENADRYVICRAGWMMGAGPKKDKKFIQKLMKQLKYGNKELFIVNDKDGTPTYTHDFALTVKELIQKEYWGLYNCVCSGETSRLEVAEELVKLLGKEDEIKITSVSSDHFKNVYYAERPPSERLITKKLDLRGVNKMQDWKAALKEYLDVYYEDYLN